MMNILTHTQHALRLFAPRRRPSRELYQLWHVRKVMLPRRSITGRLVWGAVLRRLDDGRWIYKKL